MPRAHRRIPSSHVGHITRRCHNKNFLLTFAKDNIIGCLRSWDRATTVSHTRHFHDKIAWSDFEQPKAGPMGGRQEAWSNAGLTRISRPLVRNAG